MWQENWVFLSDKERPNSEKPSVTSPCTVRSKAADGLPAPVKVGVRKIDPMRTLFHGVCFWSFILVAVGPTLAKNHDFVTVSGTTFILDGNPYYFSGANLWQGMNLGMTDAHGGNRARLCRELDRLKDAGAVNLRVMAASEGPDGEPYRMDPSLQPAAGIFNEDVFEGLDYLLYEMDARGMRAVMQLNNYWHWSGGMAQYVSWAEGSSIPYPPSYVEMNETGYWHDA